MGDIYKDFYAGAQNCINTSFCLDGGSFGSSNISLPRSLKIRIIANPDFWGFGTTGTNTLIEGWGNFNEGYFDFFDGHEPDHKKLKDCNQDGNGLGPFSNEERPDVSYRSVYDPENGNKHYANGVEDGIVRGGAESYLLDRGGNTADNSSCDTNNPDGVFKTNPAGYGIAPKILFSSDIYKNITGAWRFSECSGCYTEPSGGNELRNLDCSGAPKQHIQGDNNFSNLYDPFKNRCTLDKYVGESGCNADGAIAGQYAGTLTSIVRDTGVSPFLKYTFQYDGGAASGIFNGQTVGVTATSGDGGALVLFDVQHGASSTTASVVGSQGTRNLSNLDGGSWTLFDSYDPNTCCGGAAYGVDPELMNLTNSPLYHIDIGRVFNDPKNKIYSNRIDRTYNGLTVESEVPDETYRPDKSYVAVNEDGNALLVESGALYEIDINCKASGGVPLTSGEYVFKLDGEYSTESGIGSERLVAHSGFFPKLPRTLPYYGPFDVVDKYDNVTRSDQYGNRQRNRNATCHTKQGSLSVYPDCLTQYTQYTDCDPKSRYDIHNVPRIALVYKGCDHDDPCKFDDSGRPFTSSSEAGRGWLDDGVDAETFPTGMDDLVRGFAGQEIQMYVNLGTARGAEIKREPCCCFSPPCPGTSPPEYVIVDSPVSFPCFPKFDLRPDDYGCQDPLYYMEIMNKLGLDTDPSGGCSLPYYDACTPTQPYTTYGYIRNLCGKETNSRRGVIDSLSSKLHTGDYNDLTPADNTVEPMYVEFEQDTPDCCSPSGFPTGSTECDPGLIDHTLYGEGASGELIIDNNGNITYNVTSAGSGYEFGAGVFAIPTGTLSPEQTFDLNFGTPETGLLSFTSTPGGPVVQSGVTIPLTIVAGGSGVAGSGGFSYNSCGSSADTHYWGLTDFQGRLAMPYFRTQGAMATVCGAEAGPYVDYSISGTIVNGWPKDKVPFLVEIDHEEYCSSCSTTQMPTGNLYLSVESLSGEYLHGMNSINSPLYGSNPGHYMYGWTHNKFRGTAITPIYDPVTDTWEEDFCSSGDGLSLKYGQAYNGETCECGDNAGAIMIPRVLKGTDVPIGYSTSGSESNDGKVNSYFPLGNCGEDVEFDMGSVPGDGATDVLKNHSVYMSASIGCSDIFSNPWNGTPDSPFGELGLDAIYGCSTECATSFPAPNSTAALSLDFFYVNKDYADIFENLDDITINKNRDFLKNGLTFSAINSHEEGQARGWPGLFNPTLPISVSCGDLSVDVTGYYIDQSGCDEITEVYPGPIEDYFQAMTCVNGNSGMMEANVNLSPCLGSRVVVYSCSWWKKGVYNRYHGNSDAKFGGPCGGATYTFASPPEEVQGCPQASIPLGDSGCFVSRSGDYLPAIYNALKTGYDNNDWSVLTAIRFECQPFDSGRCCYQFDPETPDINPDINTGQGPFEPMGPNPYARITNFKGCECSGIPGKSEYLDVAYDVTYSELTHPLTAVKTTGWYGTANFPTVTAGNCDQNLPLYYWSGENLPGIGNIGPLPLDAPIAVHYQDTDVEALGDDGFYNQIDIEPFCSYHTGPNKYSAVGAEVFVPYRNTRLVDGAPNLQPELCTGISTNNEFYGNCGTPAPFDTYVAGKGTGYTSDEVYDRFNIVRKSVWPEIMTVHKVECVYGGYELHVSREYFEHDRSWYHIGPDCEGNPTAFKRVGLISGGQTAYEYPCGEVHYPDCADPSGNTGTSEALPFTLPVMTPTDAVGPIIPEVCATGSDVFDKTDVDFITKKTTSEEHPGVGANPSCLYFPSISGQSFYSFYNLLYDSGVPGAGFLTGAGTHVISDFQCGEGCKDAGHPFNLRDVEVSVALGPVFSSASELKNNPHSCIQDLSECGGQFWNNKEFFPRKSYNPNTRVTAFGALSVCEQNAQLEAPSWYDGHTTETWNASPNKKELSGGRFIDACDDSASVLLTNGAGLDDNSIFVPFLNEDGSAPSILTLMGKIHPGFRSTVNEKTCVFADSGECIDILAEHNDSTIRDITFSPDEYGYYLDDLVSSGVDKCLFSPFKIMVDVECCPDRVGHKGTTEPTNLNYFAKIPAATCGGFVDDPACGCETHTCQNRKEGPLLPGLSCSAARLNPSFVASGDCVLECVADTGDIADARSGVFWTFVSAETYGLPGYSYLFDPDGGDPLDAANLISTGVVPVNNLGATGCTETCEIINISGYVADTYQYAPVTDTILNIYEYSGVYFHVPDNDEILYMDVFDFEGSRYRFAGNEPGYDDNCCNPSGAIGDSKLDGCDCQWNQCNDMRFGIPVDNGVHFLSFPQSEYVEPYSQLEVGPGPPGGGDKILDAHGCRALYSQRPAFYPSAVKMTITESPYS